MIEIAVSVILSLIIICKLDWFLLWIPFLALTGRWLLRMDLIPLEYQFFCSYVEFTVILLISIKYFKLKLDTTAVWILLVGFTSVFSLFQSGDHFFYSLFFTFCFLAGPWIYLFFLKNMKKIVEIRLVDWTVLLWVVLGLLNKVYFGLIAGESVLLQRSGSYFGSNRMAGILILLFPLARNRWISLFAILFMLIQFSKGIYATLFICAVAGALMFTRKFIKIAVPAVLIGLLLFNQILPIELKTAEGYISVEDTLIGRLTKADEDTFVQSLFMRVMVDERFDLWNFGMERMQDAGYLGVGLGGSRWEFDKYYTAIYSNFHNLYITSLVEGGLIFFLGIAGFFVYILFRAYIISKPAFVGLLGFLFYGLSNGQLYEASRAPTCAEYYYLLFVAAFVSYYNNLGHSSSKFY